MNMNVRSPRGAWKEGIDSGDAGETDFTALKNEARARLGDGSRGEPLSRSGEG